MRALVRKCKICDNGYNVKSINLDVDKYVFYKNSYYHYNCFLNITSVLETIPYLLSHDTLQLLHRFLILKETLSSIF